LWWDQARAASELGSDLRGSTPEGRLCATAALLVYGYLPPVRIRLRPWFRSRRLVSLAMAVDAAVPHPAMQVDDLAPLPLHQAGDDGEVAA
jgi:hypothetical protein